MPGRAGQHLGQGLERAVLARQQQRIRKFFLAYGRNEAEKATLKNINGLSAFKASPNYQLRPVVDLELFESLTKAMAANPQPQPGSSFNSVVEQLSKRAARLDSCSMPRGSRINKRRGLSSAAPPPPRS